MSPPQSPDPTHTPGGTETPGQVLGLDMGGTKLLGVVMDADGARVAEAGRPTLRDEGPAAVLERCVAIAQELTASEGAVAAIGVGFAGLVDAAAGRVRSSVIFPGWDDLPLADTLSRRLGVPCYLDNDATTAGLGEFHALGAPAETQLVVLTVGTGIGGALFADGHAIRGAAGLAGEVGHMSIDRHGELCVCGQPGCLHTVASGTAMTAHARRIAVEHPRSRLGQLIEPWGLAEVGKLATQGDNDALKVVVDGARGLGVGIANVVQLLNPDRVSLCGGVLGLGSDWLDVVRAEVQERVFPEAWSRLSIGPTVHGAHTGALGAAWLATKTREISS
jgi:glucokinase